jgi:hypothetical protein
VYDNPFVALKPLEPSARDTKNNITKGPVFARFPVEVITRAAIKNINARPNNILYLLISFLVIKFISKR